MPRRARYVVAVAALALSGCVLRTTRPLAPPDGYVYEPPVGSAEFAHGKELVMRFGAPIETTRYHDVLPISFESEGHNGSTDNRVGGLYFRSREQGAKKLVIVLPIWGTSDYPPSKISRGYAERSHGDANVLWIDGTTPVFPWTELSAARTEQAFESLADDSAERFRTAVVDVRRLLDWAETQPDIDPKRIAVVGFSMSALVTVTLLGNDSRVKSAVIMMGAARFADVLATCHNRAGEVRKHALESYGWSLEQYRAFFAKLFAPAEPSRFRGHYDPKHILMIDAKFDDCMPKEARDALWEIMGRPRRITLPYWHRGAFYSITPLGLNFMRRKIYRFLDRNL